MRIAAALAAALLWGIWGLGAGNAADWAIVPSVNARTEFNSNINYSFTAPVSDYIFTLAPAAEFNYTTDIGQLQGRLGLTGMHYLSNGQIDRIDQNFRINGRYQAAPRWNLTLNTAYISDSTLQEELLASGLVMNRTPRQSIQAGPAVTYAVTERLAATVNYNFNKVNYQDPQFQNYTTQQVGLKLVQQLKNEKTALIGNVLGRYTQYPTEDSFRSLGFYLGANHRFSPEWEINLLGGINQTYINFQTQVLDLSQFPFFISVRQVPVKKTETNPYVDLSVTRRWTNLSVTGGYSRDQTPSAFTTISDVNRVYLSLKYDFTERFSGSLNGDYYLSNQISQANSPKQDYLNVGPQVTYKLTEEVSLSPGYRFGLRDDITGGQTATAQVVWLMLNYTRLAVTSEKTPTPVGSKPASITGWERPGVAGRIPFQRY